MNDVNLNIDLGDPFSRELGAAVRDLFAAHLVAEQTKVDAVRDDSITRVLGMVVDAAENDPTEIRRRVATLAFVAGEWSRLISVAITEAMNRHYSDLARQLGVDDFELSEQFEPRDILKWAQAGMAGSQ